MLYPIPNLGEVQISISFSDDFRKNTFIFKNGSRIMHVQFKVKINYKGKQFTGKIHIPHQLGNCTLSFENRLALLFQQSEELLHYNNFANYSVSTGVKVTPNTEPLMVDYYKELVRTREGLFRVFGNDYPHIMRYFLNEYGIKY